MNPSYHYTATLQMIMAGFGCGWITPTITAFNNVSGEFSLTDEDCSWITSLHYAGRIAGAVVGAAVMDRIGRVSLIVLVSILQVLIWIGVALIRIVFVHYIFRLVFGISIGFLDIVLPVYIGENSLPNLRGIFSTTCSLFSFGGQILAFAMATYMAYVPVAAVAAGIALFNLALLFQLRQPAQYLLQRGREKEAQLQFHWLRGHGPNVDCEFDQMKAELLDIQGHLTWDTFANPGVRITCAIHVLAFLTGFPSITVFLAFILEPTSVFDRKQLIILFGVIQFLAAALAASFIERFGRRTLWIACSLLFLAANMAVATLHYCLASGLAVVGLPWLLFGAVATYGISSASIMLTLLNSARGELLPAKFKASGNCTAIILNSIIGFGSNQTFLVTVTYVGVSTTFLLYSLSSLILLIYIYLRLPETKGLTLMEIQKLFEE